jgi:pyruvate/2-oxoglutarate/acetoin dehydrogenase E1 component
MSKDDSIILIGEDIGIHGGAFGVYQGLWEKFGPERIICTPISELAIVGAGVGAAMTGMRPIAEIMYMDFITLAMDQIVNQAAKICYMYGGKVRIPLVIRTQGGGGRGNAAQHSQSLEAWFVHVPGLKVVMPSTPYDAKGLLKSAIKDESPVIFIEHKMLYRTVGEIPDKEYYVPLGKADIKRKGNDVTIIATSAMIPKALKAAEILFSEHDVDSEVIDPRTLKPLDISTIGESIKKTGHAIIVHEACKTGGIGAEICAQLIENVFDYLDAPIKRVCAYDTPIPYSMVLEDFILPDERRIVNEVLKF